MAERPWGFKSLLPHQGAMLAIRIFVNWIFVAALGAFFVAGTEYFPTSSTKKLARRQSLRQPSGPMRRWRYLNLAFGGIWYGIWVVFGLRLFHRKLLLVFAPVTVVFVVSCFAWRRVKESTGSTPRIS